MHEGSRDFVLQGRHPHCDKLAGATNLTFRLFPLWIHTCGIFPRDLGLWLSKDRGAVAYGVIASFCHQSLLCGDNTFVSGETEKVEYSCRRRSHWCGVVLHRAEFPGSVGCRPDNLSSLRLGLLFSPGFHLCCQEASYEGCNMFSMCVCVCVWLRVWNTCLCVCWSP